MEDLAEKILIGIMTAAVSSWITVRLSLAKFRTEKWWERKIDAYSKVIEAFHDSKSFFDSWLNAEVRGKEPPEKVEIEVRTLSIEANNEINKYANIGSFVFSDEFYRELKQYQKDFDEALSNSHGWTDYLINGQELTERYLKELIIIAKKDLRP